MSTPPGAFTPSQRTWLTRTSQTSELVTPDLPACSCPGTRAIGSGPTHSPRLLLPWQLAQPGPLTYPVSLQVPGCTSPGVGLAPRHLHHHQQVRGFNLPASCCLSYREKHSLYCLQPRRESQGRFFTPPPTSQSSLHFLPLPSACFPVRLLEG